MQTPTLARFCASVVDVAIEDAKELMLQFAKLADHHSLKVDDTEFLLKTFIFMNYVLIVNVWSSLPNDKARWFLSSTLKSLISTKLTAEVIKMSAARELLFEELSHCLDKYIEAHEKAEREFGRSGPSVVRAFAFAYIQGQFEIDQHIMDQIAPTLVPYHEELSKVESVAMQLNKAIQIQKPKGFLKRIFGK